MLGIRHPAIMLGIRHPAIMLGIHRLPAHMVGIHRLPAHMVGYSLPTSLGWWVYTLPTPRVYTVSLHPGYTPPPYTQGIPTLPGTPCTYPTQLCYTPRPATGVRAVCERALGSVLGIIRRKEASARLKASLPVINGGPLCALLLRSSRD